MRHFDDTFWFVRDVLRDILRYIMIQHDDEKLWWDILMALEELWWPVMTFDDLWYGDNVNGMALWQFWLSLVILTINLISLIFLLIKQYCQGLANLCFIMAV